MTLVAITTLGWAAAIGAGAIGAGALLFIIVKSAWESPRSRRDDGEPSAPDYVMTDADRKDMLR